MQASDEIEYLDADGELPGVNVTDAEIGAWFWRKFGRCGTWAELRDVLAQRAIARRIHVIRLRRAGCTKDQIIDALTRDFLLSDEFLYGAALSVAMLSAIGAALTQGYEIALAAGVYWDKAQAYGFAPSPSSRLRELNKYIAAKLQGDPVPSWSAELGPDLLAAVNAAVETQLWGLQATARDRRHASEEVARRFLDDLEHRGKSARAAHPDLASAIGRPEPGPARGLDIANKTSTAAVADEAAVDAVIEKEWEGFEL